MYTASRLLAIVFLSFAIMTPVQSTDSLKSPRPGDFYYTVVGGQHNSLDSILQAITSLECSQSTCCQEIIDLILTLSCVCAPIAITTPTVLTQPGFYCLAQDITGPIIIDANNIALDLNNHTINNSTSGIIVNATRNIYIFNGHVSFMSDEGIIINDGAENIRLESITVDHCGNDAAPFGIRYAGSVANPINGITVKNCTLLACFSGIALENVNQSELINCTVENGASLTSDFIGFLITSNLLPSVAHILDNCSIVECQSLNNNAYGFFFENTEDVSCKGCSVLNLGAGLNCYGIRLLGTNEIAIREATISSINSTEITASAAVSGIQSDNSANSIIENCQILGIGNAVSSLQSDGIHINDGAMFVLKNVVINNVSNTTGQASGFTISAPGSLLQDCSCANIISLDTAIGFFIPTSTVTLESCVVEDVIGTTSAIGFYLANTEFLSIFNLYDCHSQSCTAANSYGFILTNVNAHIQNCSSSYNLSTLSSQGFTLMQGSNAVMKNCDTTFQASFPGQTGGIVVDGSQLELHNCSIDFMFGFSFINGVYFTNNSNGSVFNSSASNFSSNNTTKGFFIENSYTNLTNCTVWSAGSNEPSVIGFHILGNGRGSSLLNCHAQSLEANNNGIGFFLEGPNALVQNSLAKEIRNGTGFEIAATGNMNVIKECIAENNFNGFIDNGTNSIVCDCFAANNNGGANNYSGGIPNVVIPGTPTIVCGNTSA